MAKRKIFVDTDAGWDDWIALILLCTSQDVDVVGVSVNGVGEAHITPGVQNIVDLLAYIGRTDIPVYVGPKAPISYSNVFPNSFRNRVDSFYGFDMPKSGLQPSPLDYREGLRCAVSEYPQLEVLSIGGFTGLRHYMDYTGAAAPSSVVAMGGAVDVAGNIADLFAEAYPFNTTGEWNLFIDPTAADQVVQPCASGFYSNTAIRFVPLDASYQVPLTQDVVEQYEHLTNKAGTFVYYVLNLKLQEAQQGGYGEFFYDPLAAAIMLNPSIVESGGEQTGTFSVTCDFPDEMQDHLGTLVYTPQPTAKDSYISKVDAQSYYLLMYQSVSSAP